MREGSETGPAAPLGMAAPSAGGRTGAAKVRSLPAWRMALTKLATAADPLRLAGIVLFLLVWQGLSAVVPPIILPSPLAALERLQASFWDAPEMAYFGIAEPNFYANLVYTAQNVAIAVAAGAAIGIVAGLVSARYGLFRAVVDPFMMTAGTVPILVAAPFLLIWFGVGRASAVCLVIFYVTVMLYVFAQRAASNVNPIYEDFARTLGASRRRIVTDILIPATVPEILGGLRIALAGAWGLEAISELLGSQEGMGKILEVLAGATDTEGIMAALLLLGFCAILADAVAAWTVRRLASWSASQSNERT